MPVINIFWIDISSVFTLDFWYHLANLYEVWEFCTQITNNKFRFVLLFADHHDESGSLEDPYITKTIESVGSCCTLIAEKVYNKSESLFAESPIADLLLSTILLDTVNLKLGIGRTTEKDIEFAEELEKYASCPMKELFGVAQKGKAHLRSYSSCFQASCLVWFYLEFILIFYLFLQIAWLLSFLVYTLHFMGRRNKYQ